MFNPHLSRNWSLTLITHGIDRMWKAIIIIIILFTFNSWPALMLHLIELASALGWAISSVMGLLLLGIIIAVIWFKINRLT